MQLCHPGECLLALLFDTAAGCSCEGNLHGLSLTSRSIFQHWTPQSGKPSGMLLHGKPGLPPHQESHRDTPARVVVERGARATSGTYCAWKSTTTGLGLFTTRSWKSLPSCTLKVFLRPAEVPKALPWDARGPRVGNASSRWSASLWAICGESGWWGGCTPRLVPLQQRPDPSSPGRTAPRQ